MSKKKKYVPRVLSAPDPRIKVAVCIPTYGPFHPRFGYSLAKLMLFSGSSMVADGVIDVRMHMVEGTYLNFARDDLAKTALKTDATHILWLDSDMQFPQDALMRLLARNQPIVGTNYAQRRFPHRHVAITELRGSQEKHLRCRTTETSTGLEPVVVIGFGLLLMQTSVLTKIEYPWFQISQDYGEDAWFCRQAIKGGYEVMVDHDLSKEVVHWGDVGLSYEHAEITYREDMSTQPIEVVA